MILDSMSLKLCDIQGRLFENSLKEGLNSETFIKEFMNSEVAAGLDMAYNRYQWTGEEYLLSELKDTCELVKGDALFDNETMYWIGYTYRYWHYYKNESSKNIYKIANAKTMNSNYYMFHTMSCELAIDDLIEIYKQKHIK